MINKKLFLNENIFIFIKNFVVLLILTSSQSIPVFSQSIDADERSLGVAQAVFGIVSYTRWPNEPSTIRLCVVGPTKYTDEVMKGAQLSGDRKVLVRRISLDDPSLSTQCEGVYIGAISSNVWQEVVNRFAGQPLLTISEQTALCSIGSMFCLNVRPDTVAFEVNLDSVARSGVRVNPRVLQLARRKGGP